MGRRTYVVGFKKPDERWRQRKAIYDACEAANIEPPEEVCRYFEGDKPDPAGVNVSHAALRECGAVTEWEEDMSNGYEVDVTKLPPDVTVIRFVNSY